MIFATVGHQMPFDRMIKLIDDWAGKHSDVSLFAQIGNTKNIPTNFEWVNNMTSSDYDQCLRNSEIIVAHAGTGTIIKAMEFKKSIIVMPRRASLNETRNDHQIHTVELFEKKGYVKSFETETELESLLSQQPQYTHETISQFASEELIKTISDFISDGSPNSKL